MATRKLHKPELVGTKGIRNFHLEQLDEDPVNPVEGRFWFSRNRGKLCFSYKERIDDVSTQVGVLEDGGSVAAAVNALYGLPNSTFRGFISSSTELDAFLRAAQPGTWAVTSADMTLAFEDIRSDVGLITAAISKGMVLQLSDNTGAFDLAEVPPAIYTHESESDGAVAKGLCVNYDADNDLYVTAFLTGQHHTGSSALVDGIEWATTSTLDVINRNRWTYSSDVAKLTHNLLPASIIPFGYGADIRAAAALSALSLDIWTRGEGETDWTQDSGRVKLKTSPLSLQVTFTEPVDVIAVMENKAELS